MSIADASTGTDAGAPVVDGSLITRLCCDAVTDRSTAEELAGVDVRRDPLDGAWQLTLPRTAAETAVAVLRGHGIDAQVTDGGQVRAIGWDARLLRRRLGILLAGVDDLNVEWDATAELARYHADRRTRTGIEVEPWEVLADVEHALRASVPLPHHAPVVDDTGALLELCAAAEDAYQQLIARHLDHAEQVLAAHLTAS